MKNVPKALLVLIYSTILCSCENAIDHENLLFNAKQSNNTVANDGDSSAFYKDGMIPLLVTDEIRELKRKFDASRKRTRNSDYDSYLSLNLSAIRDLPFTLKSRNGYFLQSEGAGRSVISVSYIAYNQDQQIFQIKELAWGGYSINSKWSGTPLAVGHDKQSPDDKVLICLKDQASAANAFAIWDIIPSANNPGYYVLQNSLFFGGGESGAYWDMFYYVAEVAYSHGDVKFSKYEERPSQEFSIALDETYTFKLKSLEFINAYTAKVTPRDNLAIQQATTNSSNQTRRENLEFNRTEPAYSFFHEAKGIIFKAEENNEYFAVPTITLEKIDLTPNKQIPLDTKYIPNRGFYIDKKLHQTIPVLVKPRTKLVMTYYYKVYDVEVDYIATFTYQKEEKGENTERVMLIPGSWNGRVYVDEIFEPDFEEINLDTQQRTRGKAQIKKDATPSPVILK
ncbi:MAG: hypothetical protein LBN24_04610 [Mediterranea sp.]|jgi:hypothetical protein|nr:hypothetical protein [Mediterranea sp.]